MAIVLTARAKQDFMGLPLFEVDAQVDRLAAGCQRFSFAASFA
ncbi:hypothetical protein [Blastomonas fulva]